MQITRDADAVSIRLSAHEAHLLERALERASFIDTPVAEQEAIALFCARALESLAAGR